MKKYIAPVTAVIAVKTQRMMSSSLGIDKTTSTTQALSRRGGDGLWDDEEE